MRFSHDAQSNTGSPVLLRRRATRRTRARPAHARKQLASAALAARRASPSTPQAPRTKGCKQHPQNLRASQAAPGIPAHAKREQARRARRWAACRAARARSAPQCPAAPPASRGRACAPALTHTRFLSSHFLALTAPTPSHLRLSRAHPHFDTSPSSKTTALFAHTLRPNSDEASMWQKAATRQQLESASRSDAAGPRVPAGAPSTRKHC